MIPTTNYNGTHFYSSHYTVIVYYPNQKNRFLPSNILQWQIMMDNCTQTRCFSILNKREKSIKYIIDDWLNVNKFRNKIIELFPETRIDIYDKVLPNFTFKKNIKIRI
jgi:hypothetical protein